MSARPGAQRCVQRPLPNIRAQVVDEFPSATAFIRPGFDEPWR